ncbi:DUF485 domain-containing protein [Nocardia jinanensis]|uniref:DUF485 domain-containing protein n=1 Tax=Nocardia jinanensis TaxID=382504 RepID=A0A917RLF9_9NOCA|nr:DUF485 domain-containing protein [Nocardia jinanensis]GGL13949.1 hypothetical protein GCM10011588_30550 [Nocardia jinanensis]
MAVDHSTIGRTRYAPVDPDFQQVAASPDFAELVDRRTGFVRVALAGSILWFGAFVILTAYAHNFMGQFVARGVTVAYALGLSQFVLVWVVTAAYLRASTRVFVPLENRALEAVTGTSSSGGPA